MLINWRVLAIESFFELLGCSLTHGCLVIYGFTLLGHKTYNSFSVIGEDLVKTYFSLCFFAFKKWNADCSDYFIFQNTLFKSGLGNS